MADKGLQPGQRPRGSSFCWLAALAAGALSLSVLLGILQWLGAPGPGARLAASPGEPMGMHLKNRLSGALE